jgi:hypothetical protein
MATINFNANDVEPQKNYDPIPPNKYLCMITDAQVGSNSKNTGTLLKLTWEVIEDGPYKGAYIFDNLNVQHQNQKAQEIAQRQLSAICHATGQLMLTDTDQLLNKTAIVKVDIEQSEGYSPKNITKGYEAYGDEAAPAPAAKLNPRPAARTVSPGFAGTAAPAQAAATAAKAAPPWKK